jgi:signal peptidase II
MQEAEEAARRPLPAGERKSGLWGPLSALGLTFAVFVFALDQAHKWWMLEVFDIAARQPFTVVPGFDLVITWNRGISYGWFSSHWAEAQWGLIAVSLIVSALLWRWLARVNSPLTAAALGLIIGGALANALDRFRFGAVADFFHFHIGNFSWYIFNLADIGVVAGVALLLYESLREGRKVP